MGVGEGGETGGGFLLRGREGRVAGVQGVVGVRVGEGGDRVGVEGVVGGWKLVFRVSRGDESGAGGDDGAEVWGDWVCNGFGRGGSRGGLWWWLLLRSGFAGRVDDGYDCHLLGMVEL